MTTSFSSVGPGQQRAILPSLDHFTLDDADVVYEPAEDTFLLCDAILKDRERFKSNPPSIIVELGCGSGCVITYISQLMKEDNIPSVSFGVDINRNAALVTQRTAAANQVSVDVTLSDLASNLVGGLIDVLIFNPPYVPTPSEEVGSTGIEAAWAGGLDGREVIDQFLPKLQYLLAVGGRCYLVLVSDNRPEEICAQLAESGLIAKISLRRRARNEDLMILTIDKPLLT